jgi:hypothetical protein
MQFPTPMEWIDPNEPSADPSPFGKMDVPGMPARPTDHLTRTDPLTRSNHRIDVPVSKVTDGKPAAHAPAWGIVDECCGAAFYGIHAVGAR